MELETFVHYFANDMVRYAVRLINAEGGETSIKKPDGFPKIPNSEATSVFIDGRKAYRSDNGIQRHFSVNQFCDLISFAPLQSGQSVEVVWDDTL